MADATDTPSSTLPAVLATTPPIAALRLQLGLTQEEFGARIGLQTKGSVSLVERGLKAVSPDVALAIETLSAGAIDASSLNEIIAKARGVEWAGVHGLPNSADGDDLSRGKGGDNFPHCSAAAPNAAGAEPGGDGSASGESSDDMAEAAE